MTDPYRVLGVSPSATDDQVREAYRELSRKYHPDTHQNSPLADLAEEKMKDINVAYDQIMDMRRSGNTQTSGPYAGGSYGYSGGTSYGGSGNSDFTEVRRQIQNGNLTVADDLLQNTSLPRNAEWSFLKGTVCYRRGWLNDAFTHFSSAVNQDPGNMEYRSAYNQMVQARQGNMNGYPQGSPYRSGGVGGCSTCDLCSGLICTDCCCECFGGDLIPCL